MLSDSSTKIMHGGNLVKTLENLGLTENESRVYFASLSLGPTTIQKISRTAEVKRTTVYTVIESLRKKGLININIEGLKKTFVAESPERLEVIVDEKRDQLRSQLPEFLSLFNLKGGESVVKYYEGREAIKSVYESNIRDIRPNEKYMVVSNADRVFDIYGKWFDKFVERRGKLNIDIRMILQDSEWSRNYKKYERNYNHVIKFLPEETDLVTNLVITPQRVLIHQLNAPIIGIVIENKSVIKMHQEMFEVLWKTCTET
jgi:sugar-specific transcriptional regulator TrmB